MSAIPASSVIAPKRTFTSAGSPVRGKIEFVVISLVGVESSGKPGNVFGRVLSGQNVTGGSFGTVGTTTKPPADSVVVVAVVAGVLEVVVVALVVGASVVAGASVVVVAAVVAGASVVGTSLVVGAAVVVVAASVVVGAAVVGVVSGAGHALISTVCEVGVTSFGSIT